MLAVCQYHTPWEISALYDCIIYLFNNLRESTLKPQSHGPLFG